VFCIICRRCSRVLISQRRRMGELHSFSNTWDCAAAGVGESTTHHSFDPPGYPHAHGARGSGALGRPMIAFGDKSVAWHPGRPKRRVSAPERRTADAGQGLRHLSGLDQPGNKFGDVGAPRARGVGVADGSSDIRAWTCRMA
jgi:hypothetical protein